MEAKPLEFFKVYLSSFSSQKLGFPPAFHALCGKTMPKMCTIKDSAENLWQVKTTTSEKDTSIFEGWEEFVAHHKLVDGDFLIFKYDGICQLLVSIFGRNGLTKDGGKSNDDDSGDTPTVVSMKTPSKEPPARNSGGRCCVLRSGKVVHKGSFRFSDATPFDEPCFRTSITKSNMRSLRLSKKWIDENMICLLDNVRLINKDRKVWHARVRVNKGGIYVGDGWTRFLKDNTVEEGDNVTVAFVRSKDKRTKSLRVLFHREFGGFDE